MLSKPDAGWSKFQLDNTSVYGLSYLDDIAFEWVEQAIHGLQTMQPFCVKGCLEPGRFICTVSYWNCHIVCEDDKRLPLKKEDIVHEYSHTSMLQFCKYLYDDIITNIDEWAGFVSYIDNETFQVKKDRLLLLLEKLEKMIQKSKEYFEKNNGFL